MKKKLLILACVMMMLFGSVLTVSASEMSDSSTTVSGVGVTHYCIINNYSGWTYLSFPEAVRTLSVKLSDRTMHYFISNVPLHYQGYYSGYNNEKTLEENVENASMGINARDYSLIDDSGSRYFSFNDLDYYFYSITIMNSSTISKCNYTPATYDYSEHVYNTKNIYEERDILYYILTGTDFSFSGDVDSMEEDSTFALTGFTAGSTGKTGHIKANWTGTTHDDKIDTYKEAKYTVHVGYAFTAQPGQIATVDSNRFDGDIADKGFLQTYNSLKASDDTLFLRYLKVVPYYTIGDGLFGQSYKGKPCTIWLNEDGSIEKVVNDYDVEHGGGGNTDSQYDDTFYLTDVSSAQDIFDYLTGKRQYSVYWKGTSKIDIINSLSPDSTNVFVQCIGENEFQDKKIFDYFSMDPFLNEIHIYERNGIFASMGNSFSFNLVSVESSMSSDGYIFTGEVYLIPQYQTSGRERVRGCITSLNIFTGEVKIIKDKDPYEDTPADDDDGVVVTPPDDEDKNPDTGLPDIGGISDIPAYLLNLFNSFYSFVGVLPNFLGVIFPFIPEQIRGLLGYGLLLVIVLRVLGR